MPHLMLLGDSVLDNGAYVPAGPSVSRQVQQCLYDRAGAGTWEVTLGAEDGSITSEVGAQLNKRPDAVTHLAVSSGGNDALERLPSLMLPTESVKTALETLTEWRDGFRREYRALMSQLQATGLPVLCCTIYDRIPSLDEAPRTALVLFNDVILREAARAGFRVLDTRRLCTDPLDYSDVSDIEPSARGGAKIADGIARWAVGR